jgi:hypothetical protein
MGHIRERKCLNATTSKLQNASKSLFKKEFARCCRSLEFLARQDSPDAAFDAARFKELKSMISTYFFPLKLDDREQLEDRPRDYFAQTNNELRPMADVMDLNKFWDEIAAFVSRLPTDHFHFHFHFHSNVVAFCLDDRTDG